MFDVCVVGHATRDVILLGSSRGEELPGGTANYTSLALRRLGLAVALVTKLKPDDDALVAELRRDGVAVDVKASPATTTFENLYRQDDPNARVQTVTAVAAPFSPEDVQAISARVVHVGSLTNRDVTPAVLREARTRAGLVSLDVQGLVREVIECAVRQGDWPEKEAGLAHIDIVKADETEAALLSGASEPEEAARRLADLGPKEVIITMASRGSLVLAGGRLSRIPAFPPKTIVDPTGCGDTYVAGYLFQKLKGREVEEAARFGAALATLKLEHFGPVRARAEEAAALAVRG
ncbi:MAG: PfkB family carbohydrate kinase [Alphaproteobacteria bacterium]